MRGLFSQLGFRLAAASGALAVLIGATFGLLLFAIDDVRMENRLADRARTSLTASDGVAETVLELETGERGFVITGEERFLGPWRLAMAEFPARARTLERLLRTRSRTVELYGLLFATDRRSPVPSSCHVRA